MDVQNTDITEFLDKLPSPAERDALQAVHERLTSEGYKLAAKHKGEGFDLKYSIKSRKPIAAIFLKKGAFEIHLRPLHVAEYSHRFGELSEHIRDLCLSGNDCRDCGYCNKAYLYEYAGTTYRKCQFICTNFCLTEISGTDIPSIALLLEMELGYI